MNTRAHRCRAGICAFTLASSAVLSGCERLMQDMYQQPKHKPLEASRLFSDRQSSRPIPPGTIGRSGPFAGASSGRVAEPDIAERETTAVYPLAPDGTSLAPEVAPPAASIPFAVTLADLRRGQQRFDIYCAPCHSRAGDGDGMIVRRGFPQPPSYHTAKLRNAPDSHFYDVITHGYGAMYSYADRVAPDDRWRIVAYIRALQLSQHAQLADVPEAEQPGLAKADHE